jgi:cysteine synthase B
MSRILDWINTELERGSLGESLLSRVGNTPLLRIDRVRRAIPEGVTILAKAEWFNPGGSIKDRAALWMIMEGERSGQLRPGKVILDATSGNTGIGYAWIGRTRGYRVKLVMPAHVSEERKKLLKAYGAELVLTDPLEGSDGAILEARRIYQQNPDLYFMPDQYNNPANWKAHYFTTGPEILAQTRGQVTHFVAGMGTSGTLMGTGRRLKEFDPSIKVVAVEPDSGMHGIEGLKHMESSIYVPGIYDPSLPDLTMSVTTEEAYETARRLAYEEGLMVGPSSGAAMAACLKLAAELREGVIVTVFPDAGDRYLSTPLWEDRRVRRVSEC